MKQLETHLRAAIAALIRAQAEAEVLGLDGVDHDLFLLRLEVQRIANRPTRKTHAIPGQTSIDQVLGARP